MHIILTHEQADFDALASLLGAYMLYESALPVLPHRMNRNVRAFLALYGADLPFVERSDLPGDPIKIITLVDTQSMVSVRGVSLATQVHAIDHHPLREGLPEGWTVTSTEVGANTTLLVEALREQNGLFTTIQSTLFLLGIYEDTGSLTYARTTARDLRAAAYLIEQGASLQIAINFLNHPLSQLQQDIYDRLRASVRYIQIHGYTIVMAYGDAREMEEELSSIVHKLRDLLDPDAIFVLVTTKSGVQVIARSTTDHIDVAAILGSFGGGGHDRAAACLVKDRELKEVYDELVGILPEHVHPAITVAQIMSRGPQLLSPTTSVDEAARRMQRFGHEGYPVVEDGKVVGLLTRRAVDRAQSHKLPTTVSSLMEVGKYTVNPDDSIEHVQRLVTDTGWGQIPVVDPNTGAIIGIVTRTDLLQNLTPGPKTPGHLNLSSRLETAMPPDRLRLLKIIAEAAHEQHAALYLVGGFVRDLLLEHPSPDFDMVVEGDAIILARGLALKYGGRVTGHARFGTAKWHLNDPANGQPNRLSVIGLQTVDLVSARTEFYTHPTALPTVERGSIKLDLHRRDFTINTLALRLDGHHYGELQDYWGGLEDLRSGLVRVLHSLSFVDDPTRILRAVRFEQRFSFRIEDRTMQLLVEARPLIERLSGDRIRHELNHILSTPHASQIMSRLNSLGLLKAIQTYLIWDDWLADHVSILETIDPTAEWELSNDTLLIKRELAYVLWLIRLPIDRAKMVIGRLKLSTALSQAILSACELWRDQEELAGASPSALVTRLEEIQPISRYVFYFAVSDVELRDNLLSYVTRWKAIQPMTDGDTLKSLGLQPGPVYKQILGALRDAWLDGRISTPEDEKSMLSRLLSAENNSPDSEAP
jgi:tRNA nucleotidyltransferase (CCA-adding enzyme)